MYYVLFKRHEIDFNVFLFVAKFIICKVKGLTLFQRLILCLLKLHNNY